MDPGSSLRTRAGSRKRAFTYAASKVARNGARLTNGVQDYANGTTIAIECAVSRAFNAGMLPVDPAVKTT